MSDLGGTWCLGGGLLDFWARVVLDRIHIWLHGMTWNAVDGAWVWRGFDDRHCLSRCPLVCEWLWLCQRRVGTIWMWVQLVCLVAWYESKHVRFGVIVAWPESKHVRFGFFLSGI